MNWGSFYEVVQGAIEGIKQRKENRWQESIVATKAEVYINWFSYNINKSNLNY